MGAAGTPRLVVTAGGATAETLRLSSVLCDGTTDSRSGGALLSGRRSAVAHPAKVALLFTVSRGAWRWPERVASRDRVVVRPCCRFDAKSRRRYPAALALRPDFALLFWARTPPL